RGAAGQRRVAFHRGASAAPAAGALAKAPGGAPDRRTARERGSRRRRESGSRRRPQRHRNPQESSHRLHPSQGRRAAVGTGRIQARQGRRSRGQAGRIVPGSEANRAVLDTILTHASVSPASVQHIFLRPGDIASAIEKNLIQAVLVVAPLGDSLADEVVSALWRGKSAPELIAIKDAEAIARRDPAFEKVDIPAGFFAGRTTLPKEDLPTLSVSYLVVARQSLAESVVTDITKGLFAIRQELTPETPLAQYIEAPDTTRGGRVPLHPGAEPSSAARRSRSTRRSSTGSTRAAASTIPRAPAPRTAAPKPSRARCRSSMTS